MASGTITGDGSIGQNVTLRQGVGCLFLAGTFGSATVTLQLLCEDGALRTVKSYTQAPDPNPDVLDFGAYAEVTLDVSGTGGSPATSVYWEIRSGRYR